MIRRYSRSGPAVPYVVTRTGSQLEQNQPLVVFLHGAYREPLTEEKILELNGQALSAFGATARDLGAAAVLIAPTGFGNTRFEGIGAIDVLRAIADVCSCEPIDVRRISLIGVSMGGYAALRLAMEFPEYFAGVCTIGAYIEPERWPGPGLATTRPWEIDYLSRCDLRPTMSRLRGFRVVARHARHDLGLAGGVPVEHGRQLEQLGLAAGVDIEYLEWPSTAHEQVTREQRIGLVTRLLALRARASCCPESLARTACSDTGTISDLTRDRVAFVIPADSSSSLERELFLAIAESERRRYVETFGGRMSGHYRSCSLLDSPPIMTDEEYLESDWDGNIVLYGRPRQNIATDVYSELAIHEKVRTWCRNGMGSLAIRTRLCCKDSSRVIVANVAEEASLLAAGFSLDYGRAPGFVAYDRNEVVCWGRLHFSGVCETHTVDRNQ